MTEDSEEKEPLSPRCRRRLFDLRNMRQITPFERRHRILYKQRAGLGFAELIRNHVKRHP